MNKDHLNTLLLPLESGLIEWPDEIDKWAFFNAVPLPDDQQIKGNLVCEQAFRPDYIRLEKAGYEVTPQIEPDRQFQGAMILLGRVRAQNELALARAFRQTLPGSIILVCGTKTAGVQSIRKWVSNHHPVMESLSKHHAVAFWCVRGDAVPDFNTDPAEQGNLFSKGIPDRGSALLASCFDKRIKGKIADLGSGWGYLTGELLQRCEQIASVDLHEADWHSLELAKARLGSLNADNANIPLSFHWVDILSEFKKKPMDWVIMNPPFHRGLGGSRIANADIGKAFIQAAGSTLIPGGRLLMVANRALPYEETLGKVFRRFEKIAEEAGYKVFEAVK